MEAKALASKVVSCLCFFSGDLHDLVVQVKGLGDANCAAREVSTVVHTDFACDLLDVERLKELFALF